VAFGVELDTAALHKSSTAPCVQRIAYAGIGRCRSFARGAAIRRTPALTASC